VRVKKAPTEESPSPVTSSPRSRKRKGRQQRSEPRDRGTIALSEGGLEYVAPKFSGFAPRIRGAKIRNSKRWIKSTAYPLTGLSFPYFDKLGKFTGTSLFEWSCDPRQFVASAVSTVASRLIHRCLHFNSMRLVERNLDRIVRVSYYYVTSKNNWFWDRILFFAKNLEENGRRFHQLLLKFLSVTDANKRFVYSHVCSQTQWLLFRAERPRDKSAIERRNGTLLKGKFPSLLDVGSYLADIALAISNL